MESRRINGLESLRGLMALWVVFGHVLLSFQPPEGFDGVGWRILSANSGAVDVFIILSGFVIFHLIDVSGDSYGRYIARRFLRLFPAYLVCLMISVVMLPITEIAIHSVTPFTQRTFGRIAIFHAGLDNFWPHLLAHLSMLHGAVPAAVLPFTDYVFLGQAWSISVEWQFYLLAPLLFWLLTMRLRFAGLCVLALLIGAIVQLRWFFNEGYIGAHAGYFALGCASYVLWKSDQKILASVARFSTSAILVASIACIYLPERAQPGAIWFAVLFSCNSMRYSHPSYLAQGISAVLETPALRWLGKVSYSVYLVHMIVLNFMLWGLEHAGLAPITKLAATFIGTTIGTLVAAELIHRWIEAPFIVMGRNLPAVFFAPRPALSATTAATKRD